MEVEILKTISATLRLNKGKCTLQGWPPCAICKINYFTSFLKMKISVSVGIVGWGLSGGDCRVGIVGWGLSPGSDFKNHLGRDCHGEGLSCGWGLSCSRNFYIRTRLRMPAFGDHIHIDVDGMTKNVEF